MLKDNTEFRDRFARWKAGEQVYENGRPLPAYTDGKNNIFDTFVGQLGPSVYRALSKKGNVKDKKKAWDYMMRHLAYESDYGRSKVAKAQHNYGGYGWNGKTYTTFKDDDAFVNAYVDLMTSRYIDAVNSPNIYEYGRIIKKKGYHQTPEKIYTGNLANMNSLSQAMQRHLFANRELYALPGQPVQHSPYRDEDYNYYRANQLGYKPDETGHMPSRDHKTGEILKYAPHSSFVKSMIADTAEGYQTYYNKQDGKMYSDSPFKIDKWAEDYLLNGWHGYKDGKLPGYGGGKGAFGLMPIDITSTLRNLYRAAKNRAYRTITPQDYNIPKATRQFISGNNRDKQKISPIRNEEWARYLGVPYEGESGFEPSPYRPQKGKTYNTVLRFKDESEILSDQVLNQMLEHQRKTGKNSQLVEGNGGGLGSYTLSLGEDKQGKYISYYDDWDINPFKGVSSKVNIPIISNIEDIIPGSNPYTVYGRRYYTEGDVKNLHKNNTRNEPRNK